MLTHRFSYSWGNKVIEGLIILSKMLEVLFNNDAQNHAASKLYQ